MVQRSALMPIYLSNRLIKHSTYALVAEGKYLVEISSVVLKISHMSSTGNHVSELTKLKEITEFQELT